MHSGRRVELQLGQATARLINPVQGMELHVPNTRRSRLHDGCAVVNKLRLMPASRQCMQVRRPLGCPAAARRCLKCSARSHACAGRDGAACARHGDGLPCNGTMDGDQGALTACTVPVLHGCETSAFLCGAEQERRAAEGSRPRACAPQPTLQARPHDNPRQLLPCFCRGVRTCTAMNAEETPE